MSHSNDFKQFKSETDFLKAYANIDLWSALKSYANPSQRILLNQLDKNKTFIQNTVLANIARFKWYKQGYYKVLNSKDPIFKNMTFVMN